MKITIVAIALALGLSTIAGCNLDLTASASCEFPDGDTTYILRRRGGSIVVTQRSEGDESSMSSIGEENARRGALMLDTGEIEGTMLFLSSSDTTRVEVSGRNDVVPDACESLSLSMAIAPVKAGDEVSVRGFNADGEQFFEHAGSVHANSSSMISSIGTPPSS